MSKQCSRCEKSVYPTEELKCLDKVWHKACFKCQTCSMVLNMKTYKGYNKLPYCEAHIPKAKATTVVETPEMRRLAENTKLQSQVQYHADFEKSKGKFTQVADDPETLRIKANTKIISNVTYHGELEKKAAMEQKRNLAGDEANGHEDVAAVPAASPEPVEAVPRNGAHVSPPSYQQQQQQQPQPQQHVPVATQKQTDVRVNQQQGRRIGSITDYDPVNEGTGSVAQTYHRPPPPQQQQQQAPPQQTQQQKLQQYYQQQQRQHALHVQQQQALQQQLAMQQQQQQQQQQLAMQQQAAAAQQQYYAAGVSSGYHQPAPQHQRANGRSFRAMYDYDADDDDEVSFRDGDVIVDCKSIDEGWMTGTVLRTGRTGMVPANYVEPIN